MKETTTAAVATDPKVATKAAWDAAALGLQDLGPRTMLSDCSGSNALVLIRMWAELLVWESAIEIAKTP